MNTRRLLAYVIGASAIFISVGFWGRMTNGYENIYFENRLNIAEKEMFALIKKHTSGKLPEEMGTDGQCNFWAKNIDEDIINKFTGCGDKYGKAIVVLGDSHAMNIYNALYRAKLTNFLVGIAQGGCRPHMIYEVCQYEEFKSFMSRNGPNIDIVIFNQAGIHLLQDQGKYIHDNAAFAADFSVGLDYVNIRTISDYLNELAKFGDIVWLGPFVETGYDFRNVRHVVAQGLKIDQKAINIYQSLDVELNNYFSSNRQEFKYVSLMDILPITPDFLKIGDCVTYRNEDHFSICGENIVGEKITAAFDRFYD